MGGKIRKHLKIIYPLKPPPAQETLHAQSGSIPLNIIKTDRISFSVLRNENNNLRKIENISYEINIKNSWEWIVRYDDHGGKSYLHRHYRLSLKDNSDIISIAGIKKYKNKDHELTWVCKDIKGKYLAYRSRLLKKMKLDLY